MSKQTASIKVLSKNELNAIEYEKALEELRAQNAELLAERDAAELQRSRYLELFHLAPDGYLITDVDGVIQESNLAAHELFASHQKYLYGHPLARFIDAKSQKTLCGLLLPFDADEGVRQAELSFKSGEKKFMAIVSIAPVFAQNGELEGWRWMMHDITERIRREDLIREQSEMLEQTYDAIFAWELDGGITFWNRSAEQLYGYSRAEALGNSTHELLKTTYPIPREKFLAELKGKGRWEGELIHTTKTRQRIIVESRLVLTEQKNSKVVVLETTHDITARQESEERIRQQASLLDKTQDAVLVCDLSRRILFWNKGAEKIYGWKTEEALGREICDVICSGDQSATEKALKAMENADEWQDEVVNFTKDNKKIITISRWTRVRSEEQNPDYFLIVNTDITDIKRTEEHLLRAQRMESIGTLAGGIAHDLNNILSPITMSVGMLQANEEIGAKSEPWLSIIKESAMRGTDLTKQVLVFTRGTEGERIEIGLRHLIKDLIKIFKETFPKTITVRYEIQPELFLVSADPTQLHQVLMNLGVNARDAMPYGGTLEIKARNILIDEMTARMNMDAEAGNYVLLTVEDTGEGIPEEVLNRIWDPFFTTKDAGKGTGLGLSTVLSIIKSHRGFINVYSEPRRGTRFSVYLPASANQMKTAENEQSARYPRGNGELILVVDDEANIRQVTTAMLEKYDYRTLSASDGTEALAAYAQNKNIALVITDMAMPYMDGAATIRALRKINPEIKIIAASGLTDEQKDDLKNLKTDAFLLKPFTVEKLLTTIAAILTDEKNAF
jgi:two-component system cell cycle sensor histidine kinase/response regulator CckA